MKIRNLARYIIIAVSLLALYIAGRLLEVPIHWMIIIVVPILLIAFLLSIFIFKKETHLNRLIHIIAINISVFVVILWGVIICYNYGIFFSDYNYFTAKMDIMRGNISIIHYGYIEYDSDTILEIQHLAEKKFGFKNANAGCMARHKNSTYKYYNSQMREYLSKRNGNGWEDRYYKLMSDLLAIKRDTTLTKSKADSLINQLLKQ